MPDQIGTKVVMYTVVGPIPTSASKVVMYTTTGEGRTKVSKLVQYTTLSPAVDDKTRAFKVNFLSVLAGRNLSSPKVVFYAVVGPLTPPPPPEGGEPEVLPPEDCSDGTNPATGCCVPDLNRVIEARVGVLNSEHDKLVAIQYLQDRLNVLVREFNKLALVTRNNPPSV